MRTTNFHMSIIKPGYQSYCPAEMIETTDFITYVIMSSAVPQKPSLKDGESLFCCRKCYHRTAILQICYAVLFV